MGAAAARVLTDAIIRDRRPETLPCEYRRSLSFQHIRDGARVCLRTRTFFGYTMAIGQPVDQTEGSTVSAND
jgi:hypothetical protein